MYLVGQAAMDTVQSHDSMLHNDTATRTVKLQAAAQVLQVRCCFVMCHSRGGVTVMTCTMKFALSCRPSVKSSHIWRQLVPPQEQLQTGG